MDKSTLSLSAAASLHLPLFSSFRNVPFMVGGTLVEQLSCWLRPSHRPS